MSQNSFPPGEHRASTLTRCVSVQGTGVHYEMATKSTFLVSSLVMPRDIKACQVVVETSVKYATLLDIYLGIYRTEKRIFMQTCRAITGRLRG